MENMTPRESYSESLTAIPISTEIAVHSTITVFGTGMIVEGNDGVMEYASAHVEGVDPELTIPSASNAFSCQPDAIEAVRRRLPLHIGIEWRGCCSKPDRR